MDNLETTTLPDHPLSDLENLDYLFKKYRDSVERGNPNQKKANVLKKYIDTIQVKNLVK